MFGFRIIQSEELKSLLEKFNYRLDDKTLEFMFKVLSNKEDHLLINDDVNNKLYIVSKNNYENNTIYHLDKEQDCKWFFSYFKDILL